VLGFNKVRSALKQLSQSLANQRPDPLAIALAVECLLSALLSTTGYRRRRAHRLIATTTMRELYLREGTWARVRSLPEPLATIVEDVVMLLDDSIRAPEVAESFDATAGQLLNRVRGTLAQLH
jgi:hypothetical protein